jgi:hypothetical protein
MRRVAWDGWTRPVFASAEQAERAERAGLRVVVSSDGRTSFEYAAHRGETVAFVHREVRAGPPPAIAASTGSPMRDLAAAVYVSSERAIVGEEAAPVGRWQGVVLRESDDSRRSKSPSP